MSMGPLGTGVPIATAEQNASRNCPQSSSVLSAIKIYRQRVSFDGNAGHNLTGIASQFAMHLGFTCDVISVTHRSD